MKTDNFLENMKHQRMPSIPAASSGALWHGLVKIEN